MRFVQQGSIGREGFVLPRRTAAVALVQQLCVGGVSFQSALRRSYTNKALSVMLSLAKACFSPMPPYIIGCFGVLVVCISCGLQRIWRTLNNCRSTCPSQTVHHRTVSSPRLGMFCLHSLTSTLDRTPPPLMRCLHRTQSLPSCTEGWS